MRLARFGHVDLVLIAMLSIVAIMVVAIGAPAIVTIATGLPLVLFVPGYLFAELAVPRTPPVERLAISLGASIVITILVGLLLAATPLGLTPLSWTGALALFTLTSSVLIWGRRVRAGTSGPELGQPVFRWRDARPVAVAVLVIVAIVIVSRNIAGERDVAAPAQLWMLPAQRGASETHLGVRAGPAGGDYTVRVTSSGVRLYEFVVALGAEEAWETTMTFSASERARPIVARLYESGTDVEIRFVVLEQLPDGPG